MLYNCKEKVYFIANINLEDQNWKTFWDDFLNFSKNFEETVPYTYWSEQYSLIFFFIIISLILTVILFVLASVVSPKSATFEKTSVYECGFEPFDEANILFSIQFFVVGILFMIFDLELAYLFPWVMHLGILSWYSFGIMFFFLILLVIGFIYEWKKGALDWL